MNVYYFRNESFSEKMLDILPPAEKERILKIGSTNVRNASASAHMLLMHALHTEKNITAANILRTDKGKPYIEGNPFYFSLSHTALSSVCVIDDSPVGIDIEKPRPYNAKVAERVCSEKELAHLNSLTLSEKAIAFCKMWILKEARSKLTGNGFSEGFRDICTIRDKNFHTICQKSTGELIGIAFQVNTRNYTLAEVSTDALLRKNPKIDSGI